MLAIASEPILSLADVAMIGRLGVEPLAARAVASSLFAGIYWLFSFLAFGTTTLVAHHYGANEPERCGEVAFHALWVALTGGILVSFFGFLLAPKLFELMGAADSVRAQGVPYFRVRILTLPFLFFFYATVGFLRGIQNTRTPMSIAFLVNGLNVLLDYVLIYGKLGAPPLGIMGAAFASAAAQTTGGIVCLKICFASSYTAQYTLRFRPIELRRLLPLLRIGHEIAIRTAALLFSLIFATAMASRMGPVTLASHEIAIQLWLLVSYTIDGLAVAGQALVAKQLGGNQTDRGYRLGSLVIGWGFAGGLFFAVLYLVFRQPLLSLFTESTAVIGTTSAIFFLVVLFQPMNGIVFVLDGILIGASDTRFLMWAMVLGAFGIFVPISWLSLSFGWGLPGLWSGLTLFMGWRLATNLTRFLSRRWIGTYLSRVPAATLASPPS